MLGVVVNLQHKQELKTVPYMDSNRFYEHTQNLLGGVKKKWAIKEFRGQKGCS